MNIASIARKAGVDPATVSRILSGRSEPKYAPAIARAKMIRALARDLGYQPNAAAWATVSGRSHAVSLILSNQNFRSPAE